MDSEEKSPDPESDGELMILTDDEEIELQNFKSENSDSETMKALPESENKSENEKSSEINIENVESKSPVHEMVEEETLGMVTEIKKCSNIFFLFSRLKKAYRSTRK